MKTVKSHYWSPKKRVIAITLRNEGYSYRDIAHKLGGGVSFSGVRKLCARFQMTGSVENQPGKGRKRTTTPRTDRRIIRLSLNDRKATSNEIKRMLDLKVSNRTVRRRLVCAGLRARIPRIKPFLNFKQRQKRVAWAKEHVNWTIEDWSKVIWSDETRISIFGSDGMRYVRRRPKEDYLPECMTASIKHPVSIMI